MAAEAKYLGVYPALVTKIIASYVSHHNVAPEQIPDLINSVHRTIERLGMPVVIVPGSERAMKITTERDFAVAEALSILPE